MPSGKGDEPAFPKGTPAGSDGLTTRDYFAAKAMAAIISHPGMEPDDSHREGTAQLAYEFADAMVKTRESNGERP